MTFDLAATRLAAWRSARAARVYAVEASTLTCSATRAVPLYWPPSRRLDTGPSPTWTGGSSKLASCYVCGCVRVTNTKGLAWFPSRTVSAVWDQEGGFQCDQHGIVTKEWRWLTGLRHREKIVLQVRPQSGFTVLYPERCPISFPATRHFNPNYLHKPVHLLQVSGQISVTLRSGASAALALRWNKIRADILLPVVSTSYQPEARVRGTPGSRCQEKKLPLLLVVLLCSPGLFAD